MMKKYFLGIDTSNYTTSLSLVCEGQIVSDTRQLLPVKEGEKGLRQSDAVFHHTKALPYLSERLFSCAGINDGKICAVGVSVRPRDAEGSYMPCFLAGLSYASAVAHSNGVPLFEFSHQAGHIEAAVKTCGENAAVFEKPFISFHVSGGTTEALLTEWNGQGFDCRIIGGTSDASCGQIIDRAGVMMGMAFPCGKELDALSHLSTKKLTKSVSIKGGYFSMSGLENKASKYLSDGEEKADVARFIFDSIAEALKRCCVYLRQEQGALPILLAGGVMSNSRIRHVLSELEDVYFADPSLSCDNACGTAFLTEKAFERRCGQ